MMTRWLRHVDVVRRAQLGGDPTAMTPAADLAGAATLGRVAGRVQPARAARPSLQALLVAELVHNEGWELLI